MLSKVALFSHCILTPKKKAPGENLNVFLPSLVCCNLSGKHRSFYRFILKDFLFWRATLTNQGSVSAQCCERHCKHKPLLQGRWSTLKPSNYPLQIASSLSIDRSNYSLEMGWCADITAHRQKLCPLWVTHSLQCHIGLLLFNAGWNMPGIYIHIIRMGRGVRH